ncbi:hypothetical protein [Xenorhabdus bovienii]|uniref:hypothetical protein n=1 Tax=Xenorhabdus bovienii TaxID=40576 RepID=UPI0023B2BFCE|nr:hypothetical protein [Xenorhabdus bovienii]MDE9429904.1 hypothetical protein [Xenorhabdus bovienii]MDE9487503.1 hypothetical protein [Xenorhabdus bovienii]
MNTEFTDPYYESAEGESVSKKRALLELKKHGIEDPSEFFADLKEKENYDAQEVLRWLGY